MIATKDDVNYWLDLVNAEIGMRDVNFTKQYLDKFVEIGMLSILKIRDTGVFAYIVTNDFDGTKVLIEFLFYLLPEHRGSIGLVKEYILEIEQIARENYCNTIKIGANMRYKDSSFMKLLQRWGYAIEVASKDINATI